MIFSQSLNLGKHSLVAGRSHLLQQIKSENSVKTWFQRKVLTKEINNASECIVELYTGNSRGNF